jgi:hypothetical protein
LLRDVMGHADIETSLRYVDVGDDQKRDAIANAFGSRGFTGETPVCGQPAGSKLAAPEGGRRI